MHIRTRKESGWYTDWQRRSTKYVRLQADFSAEGTEPRPLSVSFSDGSCPNCGLPTTFTVVERRAQITAVCQLCGFVKTGSGSMLSKSDWDRLLQERINEPPDELFLNEQYITFLQDYIANRVSPVYITIPDMLKVIVAAAAFLDTANFDTACDSYLADAVEKAAAKLQAFVDGLNA